MDEVGGLLTVMCVFLANGAESCQVNLKKYGIGPLVFVNVFLVEFGIGGSMSNASGIMSCDGMAVDVELSSSGWEKGDSWTI